MERKEVLVADWHRIDIVAALHKRGLTMRGLSENAGLKADSLKNALHRSNPKGERIIASALDMEALLPESAKDLIRVLGYTATASLINRFGGVSLSAKSGAARERSGGVACQVLSDEQTKALIAYQGADQFYIPRSEHTLRQLRNARFVAAVAEQQENGRSIRQAMAVLCPQYGISDRVGWELIGDRAERGKSEQPVLFDEYQNALC